MKSTAAAQDKIFVGEQFALLSRRARKLSWSSGARPSYALLFLLGGVLRSGQSELRAPAALLAAPGQALDARGTNVETLSLTLAPALLLDAAVRARLTRGDALIAFRSPLVADGARLARLARELDAELRAAEAGHEMVVESLVGQITVELLRRHANILRTDELELSRVGLVDRRVRRAVELMHARLDRELPLEELAAAAYLSPFHFARLFKKVTGTAPHAYLAALRIERAQTLLASPDASVTEIAARVGYASPSHFTKAFRQSTGLTPSAFRAALVSR
jgi:AraC family transcriptional regulator